MKTSSSGRPRIGIVHPWLRPGGGSELQALWAAQALKEDFEVDILTLGTVPLADLDAAYGTRLAESGVDVVRLPVPRIFSRRGDALRSYRLARYCRRHAGEYDALLAAYTPMDFGRPGIQFVSDFSFSDPLRKAFANNARASTAAPLRESPARRLYLGLARAMGAQTKSGWRRNTTLANSRWTGRILAEAFGINARTVYPPVPRGPQGFPWARRSDGFVTVGRIVPEKNVPLLIDILDRVRRMERALHFHVLGTIPENAYGDGLAGSARQHGDWVRLEGPVYGPAKHEFLNGHRYGISGCTFEAFGISVAEMVAAGEIVWVPAGGGQVEIVDHPDLIYENAEDAAAKIVRVLSRPERQADLREHLAAQARKFTTEIFADEIRDVLNRFLENHGRRAD